MMKPGSQTVVVAMSGGVDSSVAAALLLEQGYEVIGVTMKTYEFGEVGGNVDNETSCCGLGAVHDARGVAASLGIPHYVVDFRSAFERAVIGNFVDEYLAGRTPNPCINCNREIKWGELLRKADALGAQFIATGHYARIHRDETGAVRIRRARFEEKDQSYALWSVPQDALERTLFPIGELTKPEVRERAAQLGLRTATKEESYEICFVPDNRYDRFLKERVNGLEGQLSGGEIMLEGKVVGTHGGYPFYTIGQRRGLGAFGKKMYVTGIDHRQNRITIGPEGDLYRSALRAVQVQWAGSAAPADPMTVEAKVRYKDDRSPATVTAIAPDQAIVRFNRPKKAVTPGQSVVWYSGDVLQGGGVIESVLD